MWIFVEVSRGGALVETPRDEPLVGWREVVHYLLERSIMCEIIIEVEDLYQFPCRLFYPRVRVHGHTPFLDDDNLVVLIRLFHQCLYRTPQEIVPILHGFVNWNDY